MKVMILQSYAPGEDRTHDLQIAPVCDYETDALPTALPRHLFLQSYIAASIGHSDAVQMCSECIYSASSCDETIDYNDACRSKY